MRPRTSQLRFFSVETITHAGRVSSAFVEGWYGP
jgi:hypothetical protein